MRLLSFLPLLTKNSRLFSHPICVSLLLLQRPTRQITNDTLDAVWIHPETLAMLDGAVLPDAPLDGQEPPVVAVWSLENKPPSNNQTQSQSDPPITQK